jgi:hypothetical protein
MPKMNIKRMAASLVCTGMLALFAIFVWPTRFRYEHIQNQVLVRMNRFTDEMSYLNMSEGTWTDIKPSPTPTQTNADKALEEILQQASTSNR